MASPTLVTLPASNDAPWYNFKVSLQGALYTLRMRFNNRMNRWILDIADSQNNDILVGLPCLLSSNMSGRFVISGLPTGFFFCTDDTGNGSQPTQFSFGKDHTLFYYDPSGIT